MDEKSAVPLNNPINKSSPLNQMKAILTTDGSIKIFFSTDERTDIKEQFLSKDATLINVAKDPSFSSSSRSNRAPIDLRKVYHDGDNETDEKHFHIFKQTPRQVFMSTVCHVSSLTVFLCSFILMKFASNFRCAK